MRLNSFCVLKRKLIPTNFVLIRNISKQTCICVKTSSFDLQTLEKTLAQFSPFLLDFTSPELVIRGGGLIWECIYLHQKLSMPWRIAAVECLLVAVWWSFAKPAFPCFRAYAWFSQSHILNLLVLPQVWQVPVPNFDHCWWPGFLGCPMRQIRTSLHPCYHVLFGSVRSGKQHEGYQYVNFVFICLSTGSPSLQIVLTVALRDLYIYKDFV